MAESPSRRKLTTEQVAAKCVKDNFKGWSYSQVHGQEVQGLSLFARLCSDIEKKKNGTFEGSWGACYFRQLKSLYSAEGQSMQRSCGELLKLFLEGPGGDWNSL